MAAVVAVYLTGGGVAPAAPAWAGAAGVPAAVAVDAVPTQAEDETSAMALAWRHRIPIEIMKERTESSQTFAQPDGTLRTVQSASPQRVRRGQSWAPVDPTLKLVDGVLAPVASTLDMRFSAGGSGPLLTIAAGPRSLALSWPRDLPTPSVRGDTATYPEVLPGVDLRLAAAADSFSEVLVVKNADAAKNPELAEVQFGLATSGVTLKQDRESGFIRAVDPAGGSVFVSDGAHMWDSPVPVVASGRAAAKGQVAPSVPDSVPHQAEPVDVELSTHALKVAPSTDMLTDPDTRFPVFIDPGFNGGKEIWTVVNRKNPNKSYWTDSNWRDSMRVGQSWGSSSDDDWRTLAHFDVRPLMGTQIIAAKVIVNVEHTADCKASPLQLWQTEAISKSNAVTWNNTKDRWWKQLAEVNATANKQSCPKSNDQVSFGQAAVKNAFQAATAYPSLTFVFRAKSESDQYQWKKLKPDSTALDVNYNRKPGKPTGFSFSPCYLECTGTLSTTSRHPGLTMRVADGDGGNLRYEYEVYDSAKTTAKSKSGTEVTGVKSNAAREWKVTAALADGQYYWRGRGCDSYICGAYSDWIGFKVDNGNPRLPTVDSNIYKPTGWNGGPGVTARFTFRPGAAADGVSRYGYSLNHGPVVMVTAGVDGIGWKDLAPGKDFFNEMVIESFDRAGNASGKVPYTFRVKPIGDSWWWSFDEPAGMTAPSEPENNRPLTMSATGARWADSGNRGASATFDGTGYLTTQDPVLDTTANGGLTVAASVMLPAPEPTDDPGEGNPPAGDDNDAPTDDNGDTVEAPAPPTRSQTAVSEDGTKTSMFRLGYRNDIDVDHDAARTPDPAWCFTLRTADNATAAETMACTTEYVIPGVWVSLVGVVDPTANEVRLYVNGTPDREGVRVVAAGRAAWEAGGAFAVGRGYNDGAAEHWSGGIDEVYAVPRVWTEQAIEQHAHPSEDEIEEPS